MTPSMTDRSNDEEKIAQVTTKLAGIRPGDRVRTPLGDDGTVAYVLDGGVAGVRLDRFEGADPSWCANWFCKCLTLL